MDDDNQNIGQIEEKMAELASKLEEYENIERLAARKFRRDTLIQRLINEKTKTSKHSFRFPFIVQISDVNKMNKMILERIGFLGENIEVSFIAEIRFKDNDTTSYGSIEDMDNDLNESIAEGLTLKWKYLYPVVFDNEVIPIPFDIFIRYETTQDVEEKEKFLLEEWGIIYIEGESYDWINETLRLLKNIINSTKMPPWWYFVKLASVRIRPFMSTFITVTIVVLVLIIFASLDTSNDDFIESFIEIEDVSEKLNLYITHQYRSQEIGPMMLIYAASLGVGGVLSFLLMFLYQKMFPPSMILIGGQKKRQKNIYIVYNFIWGAILTTIIGAIVLSILNL